MPEPDSKLPSARNFLLEDHLRERPAVLNIETINVCNARCCFCPYSKSERQKEQMSLNLYEKIVREYSEMGGGALLLTPIIGDFFLDSNWRERIQISRKYSNIGMISVTTNGIALNTLDEDSLLFFLNNTNFMQISLGGVSSESYREMFGVDQYERVKSNIIALAHLRNKVRPDYPLRIAFRVAHAEAVFNSDEVSYFKHLGFEVAVEDQFGNWGGIIKQTELPQGALLRRPLSYKEKKNPCFVFYLGLFVASSGKVTICGCMDAEIEEVIGDCTQETLQQIWNNNKYFKIKQSFGTEKMPDICKKCSFYEDGVKFSLLPEVLNFHSGMYPFGYENTHVMFERKDVLRH